MFIRHFVELRNPNHVEFVYVLTAVILADNPIQLVDAMVEDEFMSESDILEEGHDIQPIDTTPVVNAQSTVVVGEAGSLVTNNCNSNSTIASTTLGNIELVSDNLLEDINEPIESIEAGGEIKAPPGRSMSLRTIRVLGLLF